ncbi:hypothetical protein DEJ50_18570 [Streptomyces venezuelae]|uniref:Uncharacterized protein n=1 Tax=Streptomyces venezuelae TaxID=54571 RepID=A0A5P2D446_STRVZ|nr:hypothetical protein [Streptomyces venezuelae]QES49513.1 hypothetical protein DEJ50_18570 [Streptomyces venezuelae]
MTEIDERDRRAFIAPLATTLLTLPLAFVSLLYAGLSPMACDSCGEQAADAFDASFEIAWPVFMTGLVGVLVLLVWCWALPWRTRNADRRVGIAIAAPAVVLVNAVVFAGLLDLP